MLARDAKPNAAHLALARLEQEHGGERRPSWWWSRRTSTLLHEAAGTKSLIHMHGQHDQALCNHCQARHPWGQDAPDLAVDTACAVLRQGRRPAPRRGLVRRDALPHGANLRRALARADLFLSIGTSGNVYPASRLRRRGAQQRRAHGGAEPGAVGRRLALPRGAPRPGEQRSCRPTSTRFSRALPRSPRAGRRAALPPRPAGDRPPPPRTETNRSRRRQHEAEQAPSGVTR